jgi:hypothetical protein
MWPLPAADVQSHERINLRRFDHHIDVDFFVPGADTPSAGADFYRGDSQLVVDVGVGPDAGAVRCFGPNFFSE